MGQAVAQNQERLRIVGRQRQVGMKAGTALFRDSGRGSSPHQKLLSLNGWTQYINIHTHIYLYIFPICKIYM